VRATVAGGPAIVVATPGAEPFPDGGYGAALLLDGGALLGRPDLRAAEETLRRWMAVAALVRPALHGGRVVVGADAALPTVQALIRWDPAGHAEGELAARTEVGFPPAVAMAALDGPEEIVLGALGELELPPSGEVLGPVPVPVSARPTVPDGSARPTVPDGSARPTVPDGSARPTVPRPGFDDRPQVRALVRASPGDRRALATALRVLAASRSARKAAGSLRIVVDPAELG
jgi:primosomal protein N' (replication factor Y)